MFPGMRELARLDVVHGTLGPTKLALGVGSRYTRFNVEAAPESTLEYGYTVRDERSPTCKSELETAREHQTA